MPPTSVVTLSGEIDSHLRWNGVIWSNVIWKQRTEDELIIIWYSSSSGGDFSRNLDCNLSFWTKGIKGTVSHYQMFDRSWDVLRKKAIYIPKVEWVGGPYSGSGYKHNPNWAIRSSRGKTAREYWKLCNVIPSIESETEGKIIENVYGHWPVSILGNSETFDNFIDFIRYTSKYDLENLVNFV